MIRALFPLFLISSCLLHADLTTPGALVWTGNPTTPDHPQDTFILATDTGFTSFGGCFGAPGTCNTFFRISRPFTVTVEGTFTLTAAETTDMSGTPCTIEAGCGPDALVNGSYSDHISADGPALTFADSGANTSTNPNLPATLSFARLDGETFALTVGDYVLSDIYQVIARSNGHVTFRFGLTDDLVPADVPEPCFGWKLLVAAMVALLLRNLHRRPGRQNVIR
jgi:hypothetical protein